MDIHIQFGWWLLPLAVSVISVLWARMKMKAHDRQVSHRDLGDALVDLTYVIPATVIVLVTWLVYFATMVAVQ